MDKVFQGRVKRYYPDKGYGFVECDDGGEAYFIVTPLRAAGYTKPLPIGTLVTFNQQLDSKGRRQVFRFIAIGIDINRYA